MRKILFIEGPDKSAIRIIVLEASTFGAWLQRQEPVLAAWVQQSGLQPKPGQVLHVPNAAGNVQVLAVFAANDVFGGFASFAGQLAPGNYRIDDGDAFDHEQAALGWAYGCYRFAGAKTRDLPRAAPALVWPELADRANVAAFAAGSERMRRLTDTPDSALGPAEIAAEAQQLATQHGATMTCIVGDELVRQNWPLVHAVGRASNRPPCVIDLRWGDESWPKVTLVGKGVAFDSGGVNVKAWPSMLHMSQDMAGAATVLAAAEMIMMLGLKVRLRLLIPAVENVVAGNAYRPSDVVVSRGGLSVEIAHTDAEGRLILADALAEAVSEQPALVLDMATLTGARGVAFGPDVPVFFSNNEAMAAAFQQAAAREGEAVARAPIHLPYLRNLASRTADLRSRALDDQSGMLNAGLFLHAFVETRAPWIHVDFAAQSDRSLPGRPAGAEPQLLRSVVRLVRGLSA